jgi:hypothetical protein
MSKPVGYITGYLSRQGEKLSRNVVSPLQYSANFAFTYTHRDKLQAEYAMYNLQIAMRESLDWAVDIMEDNLFFKPYYIKR